MGFDVRGLWKYAEMEKKYLDAQESCQLLTNALSATAAAREAALDEQRRSAEQIQKKLEYQLAEQKRMAEDTIAALKKKLDHAADVIIKEHKTAEEKHQKECGILEQELDEVNRSLKSTSEYCKMLESDLEKAKKEIEEAKADRDKHKEWSRQFKHSLKRACRHERVLQAENDKLKKTRYRWIDARHGWWPIESSSLDDLAMKVPYVVYMTQSKGEEQEKRIPEV